MLSTIEEVTETDSSKHSSVCIVGTKENNNLYDYVSMGILIVTIIAIGIL